VMEKVIVVLNFDPYLLYQEAFTSGKLVRVMILAKAAAINHWDWIFPGQLILKDGFTKPDRFFEERFI